MGNLHWTEILRRTLFVAVFIAATAVSFVPPSRGAETQAPEEWIFSVVMLPDWSIADALFVYQFKGAYYLPAVELAEAYEFYVEAETDRAFMTGFAGREGNTFTLDGERNEIIIKGERESLPSDAILPAEEVDGYDIYVQLEVLNKIWPVEMRVDLPAITIYTEAEDDEALSFVRRKKREEKRSITEARKAVRESLQTEDLPWRNNTYQWFGKPVIDLQSNYTYNNNTRELSGTNNITGTQQLGQFIADYTLNYSYENGSFQHPESLRTKFIRQAADDEDLFIPTLKRVEFGDISLGQRDLIGNNASGRGVVISNAATTRTREFDRITVEGTGPPGWELELYNNNELLEFGNIEDDGEYRFEDVVLNFGNNRIRIIMYGPQGQIREVVEEHNIAGSLLSPGAFNYRAGLVDTDRVFIPLSKPKTSDDPPITQNAEISYGLTDWLTLFGSYTKTPRDNKNEKYFTVGANFNTPLGLAEIEGYRHINGGKAVDAHFITKVLGTRLNLRGSYFSRFESQSAGFNTNAKKLEFQAQANTTIPLPLVPLGLRLNVLHKELYDGSVTTELDTAQSFSGKGIRFNHSTNSRFLNEIHEASTGLFNATWNRGDWQTRGTLNYKIHPTSILSSGSGEIRYNPRDSNFQSALSFDHNFETSRSGISGQLGYDFGDILTTFDTGYREQNGWQFTLRASTSLNPYYPDKEYKLSSTSKRNQAVALGRVFLDHDNDGKFSEGDEPLEGVGLNVGRGKTQQKTDENGYIVTRVRPNTKTAIRIDESSLVDPYYRPNSEGYSFVGLRGSMPGFDFPVVETGAIDGSVWRDPSGRPVSGMRLELVKEDGSIYMTTESAYDGYYSFEFVLPGTYTVRADPAYQVNVPAETVTVSSEEIFAFGIDLYLLEPAAEENAAEEEDGASGGIAQLPTTAPAVSGTTQPAPVSALDEGSSFIDEQPSDEDSAPAVESSVDESSSLVDSSNSGGGVSLLGPSSVRDVRIGESPDEVRLVLDLTGPASYDINEGDGLIILLDLPGSIWETVEMHEFEHSNILQSYYTQTLPDKGTRVILKAQTGMNVKDHKLLPAENGKPDRLIIDLKKK